MNRRTAFLGLLVGGVGLLALVACETNEAGAKNAPGALPQTRAGQAPRLNAATFVAHGELLERQRSYQRALAQYERAVELAPEMATAHDRLGVCLNRLGRHAEASQRFRAALALNPNLPHVHNNLGFSLYLEGKYAEAEAALARALDLQPTFRRARMNRGIVLARLGRYDESLEDFTLAGTRADALYNVAVLQSEAGEYVAAAHLLEQALNEQPDFPAARDQLRQVACLAATQEATEQAKRDAEAARSAETTPTAAADTVLAASVETIAAPTSAAPIAAEPPTAAPAVEPNGAEPGPAETNPSAPDAGQAEIVVPEITEPTLAEQGSDEPTAAEQTVRPADATVPPAGDSEATLRTGRAHAALPAMLAERTPAFGTDFEHALLPASGAWGWESDADLLDFVVHAGVPGVDVSPAEAMPTEPLAADESPTAAFPVDAWPNEAVAVDASPMAALPAGGSPSDALPVDRLTTGRLAADGSPMDAFAMDGSPMDALAAEMVAVPADAETRHSIHLLLRIQQAVADLRAELPASLRETTSRAVAERLLAVYGRMLEAQDRHSPEAATHAAELERLLTLTRTNRTR